MNPNKKQQLVLLCVGLDSIRRGYETHMRRLFDHLREDLPADWSVSLVKRDGIAKEDEIVLNVPSRSSFVVRTLAHFRGDALYWEQMFFSFAFILRCIFFRVRVDRIYTPEPVNAKVLFRLRRYIPGQPEVLFMHGVWMEPQEYTKNASRIQEVSVVNYGRSKKISPHQTISLIPHFDEDKNQNDNVALEFRKKYDLGERKILLNVGVVGRIHKRTDHLIRAATQLPNDWLLLVCGPPGDPEILEEGARLLGDRFRHLNLPPEEMLGAYQAASLFVHCALTEGFGIVIIEAMRAGLPLFVHDGELFRWIVGDQEQVVDMSTEGKLKEYLTVALQNKAWLKAKGERNRQEFEKRYTWKALRNEYIQFLTE